jgi:general secretion pathway protein G
MSHNIPTPTLTIPPLNALKEFRMNQRQLRRGLSLLEVMIVLIILVGLMAIVGPRLLGTQKKADLRTAQVQIGNIASALKLYAADMKSFPTTEEGLELLVKAPEDEALARNWSGPYLEDGKIPLDPWGSPLGYEYDVADATGTDSSNPASTPEFPRIFSLGPDKQPGTTDDISNRAAEGDDDTNSTSK